MATYTRPTFVTAGDQWWSGMTQADYQKTLQPGGVNYKATTTTTPTPSPTAPTTTTTPSYQGIADSISNLTNRINTEGITTNTGTPIQSPLATQIASGFNTLNTRIQTEGITSNAGQQLVAPTQPVQPQDVSNTNDLQKAATTQQPATTTPTSYNTQANLTSGLMAQLETQRTALESAYKTQLEATQKAMQEAQAKYDEALAQQKTAIDATDPTRSATYAQEQQIRQNELDAAQAASETLKTNYMDNQKLVSELDGLLTNIQNQLTAEKAVTGLSSIREPRIAQATEQMTARVGVIEAVMAARNGQINQAYNMIDQAQSAMTAARNDQLDYYRSLQNFYAGQAGNENERINNLSSQEQKWIGTQVSLLENDLAQTQANVQYIKQAMMDPDTAMAYGNAGVTLNDTPEQIAQKLKEYGYTQEMRETSNDMGQKGYTYSATGVIPAGYESVTTTDSRGVTKTWYRKPEVSTKTPDVFGSTESGYHYWDPITGTFKTAVPGVTTASDKNEKLVALLAEIPSYSDRESAIKDLESMKTVVLLQVGQDGYNTVKAEIDRLFPEKTTETTTKQVSSPTLQKAGKATGGFLRDVGQMFAEPFKEVGADIGSFWSGLFSR